MVQTDNLMFSVFYLHWQLDHHVYNALSSGSEVKAFRHTDAADINRVHVTNSPN